MRRRSRLMAVTLAFVRAGANGARGDLLVVPLSSGSFGDRAAASADVARLPALRGHLDSRWARGDRRPWNRHPFWWSNTEWTRTGPGRRRRSRFPATRMRARWCPPRAPSLPIPTAVSKIWNIWRLELADASGAAAPPAPFIASTRTDDSAQFCPMASASPSICLPRGDERDLGVGQRRHRRGAADVARRTGMRGPRAGRRTLD